MIRKLWPGLLVNGVALIAGALLWRHLPERVVTHWGIDGSPNGWSSRGFAALFVPLLALVMSVVLALVPRIDPRYRNFPRHAGAYWLVCNAVLMLLALVQGLILATNLGWHVDMTRAIGWGFGILWLVLGNVLTRVRPNWIFGIRTPWTLSSERAWRETHRLGGYLFVSAGALVLAATLLAPGQLVAIMLIAIGCSALIPVVYSYFAWKRDPEAQQERV
jgi:uncharacterized membrane protein